MDCYFPLSLRWLPLSQLAWPQAHNTIAHAQPPILIVCYFLFFLPSLSFSIGCSLPLLSQAIVALEPQTHLPLSHYSSSLTLFLLSHVKKITCPVCMFHPWDPRRFTTHVNFNPNAPVPITSQHPSFVWQSAIPFLWVGDKPAFPFLIAHLKERNKQTSLEPTGVMRHDGTISHLRRPCNADSVSSQDMWSCSVTPCSQLWRWTKWAILFRPRGTTACHPC